MTYRILSEGDGGESRAGRALRADALRNEEIILEAAKAIFKTAGVDAPVREIAAAANVGVGTLYRRFPKRSDLIAAVFRREVDMCVNEAEALSSTREPADALLQWLKRYTRFITTKSGLAQALHSGDPAYGDLPDYFRAHFEPALGALLENAVSAGAIGSGVKAYDLLRAIGNLAVSGDDGERHTQLMVELVFDGLRFRANSKPG